MENKETKETKVVAVKLIAQDSYIESHIVAPTEVKYRNDMYLWGRRNDYPAYLSELYAEVTTLRSVVNGVIDYVAGDDCILSTDLPVGPGMANEDQTVFDLVQNLAKQLGLYGGFAMQVIRTKGGGIHSLYCLDLKYVRTNKDNSVFWYSEKWDGRKEKAKEYSKFIPAAKDQETGIVFVKRATDTGVYPAPVWAASVKAAETERCTDVYHLNAINNGFEGSAVINFNNGVPDEETRKKIEKEVNEKFGGYQNAGRIVTCWNDAVTNKTTIDTFKTEDFGAKYESLSKWSRQQLFTAFRANPNLFGIGTESTGFNQEEYESAFKLFNRTTVRPFQRLITDAFQRIFGAAVLNIKPFTLETTGGEAVVQ